MRHGGLPHARTAHRTRALLATTTLLAGLLTPTAAHAAPAAPAAPALTGKNTATRPVSEAQALGLARKSGKSVQATAATTSTSTLTANPNGTLTVTQSTVPVRKLVAGTWKNLDPTLAVNPDGTISPKVTTSALTLSGGKGALATMKAGGDSLSLSLPAAFTLTKPTLSGATATYRNVLPDVDLAVTAQDTGGFSEVLVVKNADAAANPALTDLTLQTRATGVSLRTDAAGDITATDKNGRAVFTAGAASMWDSTNPAAGTFAVTDPDTGQSVDSRTGNPLRSSAAAPGTGAHTASLKARYAAGLITLTPDLSILRGGHSNYPVFLDPTFTPSGQTDTQQAWAYVSSEYHTTAYWNPGASTYGPLHVGYIDDTVDSPNYISTDRSFIRTSVNSGVWGSTVLTSSIAFHENWSYSCTASEVDLYQTGGIGTGTTWDAQPSWITSLGSTSVAHGHSSSCSAADVTFTITSLMQSAANGKWTNATFGLRASADDENNHNQNSWKQFSKAATITTTYDHAPNQPTNLTTSPATSCTATTPTVLGKGDIALKAAVSDPDGTISPLTANFTLTNMSSGTGYPQGIDASSGTTAQATYSHTGTGSPFASLTAKTEFSWSVTVTDQHFPSIPSSTCHFYYDPTAPGAPTIAPVTSTTSYCPDLSQTNNTDSGVTDALCKVGTSTGLTITDTNTTTGYPGSYLYQLNGAAPISVPAASTSPYTAHISIKPTSTLNTLTVTAVSSGGNIGDNQPYQFLANAPATAAAGDLNGDGKADFLAAGGQDSLPAGLWLANGDGTANAGPAASNVGIYGNGVGSTQTPDSYTGTQAITGHFSTGQGFNDVLDYGYNTSTGAISAEIVFGQGDGSTLNPVNALPASTNLPAVFTVTTVDAATSVSTTHYATSIGNGGDLYDTVNGNTDTNGNVIVGYPDLLLVLNGSLYDEPSAMVAGGFEGISQSLDLTDVNPYCLAQNKANGNTACTTGWDSWSITTTLVGHVPALFARDTSSSSSDPSAGQLWYLDPTTLENLALGSAATPIEAATSGWDTGGKPYIQATDVNGDGTPDLWVLSSDGKATAQLMTLSGTTATLAPKTSQPLTTSTHAWPLADFASNTAHDFTSGTALNLNGSGGVNADTGDLFDPDVQFDGTTGMLTTSSAALDLTHSFTVSAWAKPTVVGGSVLAQYGSADVGMTLYAGSSGWVFSLNTGGGTANSYDTITGGTVQLGAWTQVTATYNKTSAVMSLYVDGVFVAYGSHTAPTTGATGAFAVGFDGTRHLTGWTADVQTWTGSALAPVQAYTPASYHQSVTPTRILDTRGTNVGYSNNPASTPVAANGTLTLQIVGDTVSPTAGGTPTSIPATATAVAVDVTVTGQTSNGNIATYADGTQRPITSSTNYAAAVGATGYQLVPIGLDGKIALYNGSTGTTHLIVDLTGYFTTDGTLTGDQTYHPIDPAKRALSTASAVTNTSLSAPGRVTAGTTFTLQITGLDGVPSNATAVAANVTTAAQTGNGFLETFPTGGTAPNATSLTYHIADAAQMSADVPIGTGGKISIYNAGADTDVLVDISGYYTSDATGDFYHTADPTRLVDTRSGVGGKNGTIGAGTTSSPSYTVTPATVDLITTAASPVLATMLTVTDTTAGGNLIAYGGTETGTSNVNWSTANSTTANLAVPPTDSSGAINIIINTGALDLVVDCSGYFAGN